MHGISDQLRLAIGVIVVGASALGYGLLAARSTKSEDNLARNGTIGIAILSIVFMAEHFVVPLRQPWNVLTLLPGLIGLGVLFKRRYLLEFMVIAVTVWWAVQFSRSGDPFYDHGLYHFQVAIWNTLDRAIPGIANLHTRLGFNSSVFVLASGLNIPRLGGWSLSFLATALIEAMMAADIVLSLRSEKKIVRVYCVIVLACLLLEPKWLLDQSYMANDTVIALGIIYAILLFLDDRSPALLLIVPFLITVKLSAAPLLVLLDWNWQSLKKYRVAAVAGLLFLCVWVTRSVLISGYLVFPIAATKLPVIWAVPRSDARGTAAWITSWARTPGKSLAETRGLGWIRPWFHRFIEVERVKAVGWMVLAGVIPLVWKRTLGALNWRLLAALALGLLYWFIGAPDVRFGAGFVFALGFLLLACGADSIELFHLDASNAWITIALLVAAMGLSAPRVKTKDWPQTEYPAMRLALTPTGNQIWTPVDGDRCWTVIPCSPYPGGIFYYPKRALLRAPANNAGWPAAAGQSQDRLNASAP